MRLTVVALAIAACSSKGHERSAEPPAETRPPAVQVADAAQRLDARSFSSDAAAGVLKRWLAAQNQGDFAAYERVYGPSFTGVKRVGKTARSFDRAGWLADRKRMFRKKLRVAAAAVTIAPDGHGGGTITFEQTWSSGRFKDVGTKRLFVAPGARGMQIVREVMLDSTVKSQRGVFYRVGRALWRAEADGSGARKLGRIDRSSMFTEPAVVSANLGSVAMIRDKDLYVREIDRGVETRITEHGGGNDGEIHTSIQGWSPDGRWLLYRVNQEYRGEMAVDVPDGVELGTFILDVRTKHSRKHEYKGDFVAFSDDSRWLLITRTGKQHKAMTLYRVARDGADRDKVVVTLPIHVGPFARQTHMAGGTIAYVEGQHLTVSPTSGKGKPVVAQGDHRRAWQSLRVAPGGKKVAVVRRVKGARRNAAQPIAVLDLRAGDTEPRQVASCNKTCSFCWYDDDHLLISAPLRMVDARTGKSLGLKVGGGVVVPVGVP